MATKTGAATRRGRVGEVQPPPQMMDAPASTNTSTTTTTTTITTNNNNNVTPATASTTTTSSQKNGGISRLPSIKERRPSMQKKARTTSVTDATSDANPAATTTTTSLQRQESSISTTSTIQRRASVPQGPSAQSLLIHRGSKSTFVKIGRRVSSMVRCQLAFQNRRKTSSIDSENEPNHMEHIHEMPRNPRFSTYLSAEAQYAMMKGYEDMLYEKIAKTNPESRLVLKRNKTPFHKKISIVDNDGKVEGSAARNGGGEKSESGEGRSDVMSSGYGSQSGTPMATNTSSTAASPPPDGTGSSDLKESSPSSTTLPSPALQPTRSQSMVSSEVSRSMVSPSHSMGSGSVGFALHRSSSLPTLEEGLSHKKRLVLTYRLESAMDILDTLKRRNKENSLSPRVFRIPRQVDAVRDFNSWTKVWNKEFKEMQAK